MPRLFEYFKPGTAAYVVLHNECMGQATEPFKGERNGRKALKKAQGVLEDHKKAGRYVTTVGPCPPEALRVLKEKLGIEVRAPAPEPEKPPPRKRPVVFCAFHIPDSYGV